MIWRFDDVPMCKIKAILWDSDKKPVNHQIH